MIDKTIDLGVEGAIWIRQKLFVKTPEVLQQVQAKLDELGWEMYAISQEDTTNIKQKMRRNWSADLPVRKGKCGSCNNYISMLGIRSHGHTCEKCGAVTYWEFIEGGRLKLEFKDTDTWPRTIMMKGSRLDVEGGYLYLQYEFTDYGEFCVSPIDAAKIFEAHSNVWELVEEDGRRLIKIPYSYRQGNTKNDPIRVTDFLHPRYNHRIVQVWGGKEYDEYDQLPVLTSFDITEAWRWAPLEPSTQLHEILFGVIGCTTDLKYYGSDPRRYWQDWQWAEMSKFVEHFTKLDFEKWREAQPSFRVDGQGGIIDVANFCHPRSALRR